MYRDWSKIPCSIIRGGTSKGIFFNENDIPKAGDARDTFILRAFGSPDIRQIDGLGGANSLTSKVAIISPSIREDADVDYTFGQVSFAAPVIDWRGNCGNLTAAVGLYAVDKGLVKTTEPYTKVRIYNTNTQKLIYATVPVKDGMTLSEGNYAIPGVPTPGAKMVLEFDAPAGSVTKKLLPTGRPKDTIEVSGKGSFTISVVDAGNPVVFLRAEELGLVGTELPVEVENMPEVLQTIEDIRSIVSERIGIVADRKDATILSPAIPKIGFVSRARDYKNPDGILIKKEDIDFVARLASMQKMHRAYMVTGAVCTGAAAKIKDTIVWDLLNEETRKANIVQIGHPYGMMDVIVKSEEFKDEVTIHSVGVGRTARIIMDGFVYVPNNVLV